MWKTCLGTNGFITQKLYGYNHSPGEVLNHTQEMEYDGIEAHKRFEAFPDPVAYSSRKNQLSGMEVSWYSTKIAGGKIFSTPRGARNLNSECNRSS